MNISTSTTSDITPTHKKRGRKSKKELEEIQASKLLNNDCHNDFQNQKNNENSVNDTKKDKEDNIPKKRGRKPKGGKIIQQPQTLPVVREMKPNVILHLKCFMKDLKKTDWDGLVGSFYFLKNDSYEMVANSDNITLIQNNTLNGKNDE